MSYDVRIALSIMQSHTIAEALTAWALTPTSTEARIRQVVDALEAIGYRDTAQTLARLKGDGEGIVSRIDAYSSTKE